MLVGYLPLYLDERYTYFVAQAEVTDSLTCATADSVLRPASS